MLICLAIGHTMLDAEKNKLVSIVVQCTSPIDSKILPLDFSFSITILRSTYKCTYIIMCDSIFGYSHHNCDFFLLKEEMCKSKMLQFHFSIKYFDH